MLNTQIIRKVGTPLRVLIFMLFITFRASAQEIDSLLHKIKIAKDDTNKVKLLNTLARKYMIKNLSQAGNFSDQSYILSQKLKYYKGKASAACIRGVIYVDEGKLDLADSYFNESEILFKELNNLAGQAAVMNEKSQIFLIKSQYDKALDLRQKALDLFGKLNDKVNQAICLTNIAVIYSRLLQFKESEKYYIKALALKKELGDERGVSVIYTNLGSEHYNRNNFKEALEYINEAIKIQEKLGDTRVMITNKTNRGNVYTQLKKYDLALKDHEECLFFNNKQGDTVAIIMSLASIGEVYNHIGKHKEAIQKYKTAESLLKVTSDLLLPRIIYSGLSDGYEKLENYKLAHEYLEKAYSIEKKIYDANLTEKIAQSKEQFDAEKREQEILLLAEKEGKTKALSEKMKLYITIAVVGILFLATLLLLLLIVNRYKRRQQLMELEKNKAVFEQQALRAQMNPHFIFNSLNSIQSYILSNETRLAYDYLAKFSKLIRQVLMNSERNEITVKDELDLLNIYVDLEHRRFKKRFEYTISCAENVPVDFKLPVMLVQPFVENAIWHGIMNMNKTEQGYLTVDFLLENDFLKIKIEDNGVGREAAGKRRPDNEYKSVGMMFTQKRLDLFKIAGGKEARIDVIDLVDASGKATGTKVEIYLPIIT